MSVVKKYFIFTGDKFGSLTVVREKQRDHRALVRCICGTEKLVRHYHLILGRVRSCGNKKCYPDFQDIIGLRFGFLYVLNNSPSQSSDDVSCRCICGNCVNVRPTQLINNEIKSCGCMKRRIVKTVARKQYSSNEERAVNYLFSSYKRGAKERLLDFSISIESFSALVQGNCHYCGVKPSKKYVISRVDETIVFPYNGLDRINSQQGYSDDNCVTCCWICNRAKLNMPIEDFMEWIKNLVNFKNGQ